MKLFRSLIRPIDASSLAVFRILFGAVLLFESVNYGAFLCLDCMYREPAFLFKYRYFEWVTLLSGRGLEWLFAAMALLAIGITIGLFYRICMLLFTVCFTYVFLLDQALYLNHFYMVILLCSIMVFVPANRCWSIDALRVSQRGKSTSGNTDADQIPEVATVPAWCLIWLIAQLEIVLIHAGIAKLNMDWLNLEPMRLWMTESSANAHPIFQWLTQDPGIALASYGVIALHLIGAPLLLWRKTRWAAFCVYAVFHTINAFVFNIGIFPWMTLAASTLFFDPDWPRTLAQRWFPRLSQNSAAIPPPQLSTARAVDQNGTSRGKTSVWSLCVIALMFCWLLVQVAVPLRHWFVPGNVAWNEGGHQFSWRMKLRDKRGVTKFYVLLENGARKIEVPATYLPIKQSSTVICLPDLIWQYARFLKADYQRRGIPVTAVHVEAMCSLNGRKPYSLINRLVDLTAIPRDEPLANWVLPMVRPLPTSFLF